MARRNNLLDSALPFMQDPNGPAPFRPLQPLPAQPVVPPPGRGAVGSGFQNPPMPAQNLLGFQGLNHGMEFEQRQVPLGNGGAQHLPPGSFGGDGGDQGVYSHHYSGGRTRRDQPAQALHQYENQFNPQVGCQGVEIQRPRMVEVINDTTVRDNQPPVGEGSSRAPTGDQDSTWAYSDVSTLSNTYDSLSLDGSRYTGGGGHLPQNLQGVGFHTMPPSIQDIGPINFQTGLPHARGFMGPVQANPGPADNIVLIKIIC